jgi:hypothetical protein
MEPEQGDATGVGTDDGRTGLHLVGGATVVLLALTEQFAQLPGAAAALASAWYLLR